MADKELNKYKSNPDVSCRVEGDEDIILYNPDIDNFILINSTGLTIWKLLDSPKTIEEIYQYITDSFNGLPEQEILIQDIRDFLDELGEAYLCRVE